MKTQKLTAAMMIGSMALGAAPAFANENRDCGDGSCQVFVAYADNFHTAATPAFPNPWQTSPSVAGRFFGNNGPWEAGAIRILNNGPDPLQVNGVWVDMWGPGPPAVPFILAMNVWSQNNNNTAPTGVPACFVLLPPKGVTIPVGKNAVFTQTCNFNFDTSDLPSPPQITCTPDGILSVVHVSYGIAAATVDFVDIPQILNTGGKDAASCGSSNESHNWVDITNNNNLPF